MHQIYRAMGRLGQPLGADKQFGATPFAPRCTKDEIEEQLFKSLIGNKGYRRFVAGRGQRFVIDEQKGLTVEWADVIRDSDNLVEMEITVSDKCYTIRSNTEGTIAKVFWACGVALPRLLSQC